MWGQPFPATWARLRPRSPPAAARQETIRSIHTPGALPALAPPPAPPPPPPGAGASGGYKTFAPTPTREALLNFSSFFIADYSGHSPSLRAIEPGSRTAAGG